MTPASLVNGEANFEWQPAEKATTQLITHVTSETAKKYTVKHPPTASPILYFAISYFGDKKKKKEPLCSPEIQ